VRELPGGAVVRADLRANAIPKCPVCGAQFCYHGIGAVISHQGSWPRAVRELPSERLIGPMFPADWTADKEREFLAALAREIEAKHRVRIAWWIAAICGAAGLWFLLLADLAK
jgi:hypothetical protein